MSSCNNAGFSLIPEASMVLDYFRVLIFPNLSTLKSFSGLP